jgi:hypothetical protein
VSEPTVIKFAEFWKWIQGHPNCILSAGTPDCMIYDHEDFHWHFGQEEPDALLVQVIRGKHLVSELLIPRQGLTHVHAEMREEEEYLFECFMESDQGPVPAYYFALSHGYTSDVPEKPGRWVH